MSILFMFHQHQHEDMAGISMTFALGVSNCRATTLPLQGHWRHTGRGHPVAGWVKWFGLIRWPIPECRGVTSLELLGRIMITYTMIWTHDMKDGHPILLAENLHDILYIHLRTVSSTILPIFVYAMVYDHPVQLLNTVSLDRELAESCRTESLWHNPCPFWWWGRVTANKCNEVQIQHQSTEALQIKWRIQQEDHYKVLVASDTDNLISTTTLLGNLPSTSWGPLHGRLLPKKTSVQGWCLQRSERWLDLVTRNS